MLLKRRGSYESTKKLATAFHFPTMLSVLTEMTYSDFSLNING